MKMKIKMKMKVKINEVKKMNVKMIKSENEKK